MAGDKANMAKMWKKLGLKLELEPPVKSYENVYLGGEQKPCDISESTVNQKTEMFKRLLEKTKSKPTTLDSEENADPNIPRPAMDPTSTKPSRRARQKIKHQRNAAPAGPPQAVKGWEYDMQGHAEQCVERYLELANKDASILKPVATPCIDDHMLPSVDFESPGVLSSVAARIVLKALYLARFGRPDTLWAVNCLARDVTKWTVACDKRLLRLISYLKCTSHWVQSCYVGDKPEDCWLALYSDASFAGDLRDSKSTSGAFLCLVGPRSFVPLSWFCKKQGAVSHSSSEAEVISLDAGVRQEGIPALNLWETILDVFAPGKPSKDQKQVRQKPASRDNIYHILEQVDYMPCNIPRSKGRGKLIVFEDNEAVIKMTIKGRSPNMRHVPRTHRIDLDWLFERIRDDPGIWIRFVRTKEQMADIFTKGSFTAELWKSLCKLSQIGPSTSKPAKRKAVPQTTSVVIPEAVSMAMSCFPLSLLTQVMRQGLPPGYDTLALLGTDSSPESSVHLPESELDSIGSGPPADLREVQPEFWQALEQEMDNRQSSNPDDVERLRRGG
jgi:hypothetical protein